MEYLIKVSALILLLYLGYKQQADKYFETFFKYLDIIAKNPYSFESVEYIKQGYRRCVCGPD